MQRAVSSPELPTLDILATEPGQLRVIRRNGKITHYDDSKIAVAVTKAFLAVEGGQAADSARVREQVNQLTQKITENFKRRWSGGGTIHIEAIQDQVILALMLSGEREVATEYILYREKHRKLREASEKSAKQDEVVLNVQYADGRLEPLDRADLAQLVEAACTDLDFVSPAMVLQDAERNLFDGVKEQEVHQALLMSARALIEREPNYSYVAARLLLNQATIETLQFLKLPVQWKAGSVLVDYRAALPAYVARGVELELLDPRLLTYDLARLADAIVDARNQQFAYLGLQTLYDRYFIHNGRHRIELAQIFFMRVAMGLALRESDKDARAIEFYNVLSSFDYMSSTPTLFNSGTLRPQLSSCFLTTVQDDLFGIYEALQDNAQLSKFAGGLGNDWTSVRASGAHIKGTNGKSSGVVPFLNVANATAVAVNQGGKRKGAVCAYLEVWHRDIKEFLELRKNTGDERRRTHDMNTACWIPDLFMKRVFADKPWSLFSPDEVPGLHDLYGAAFEQAYEQWEAKAERGEIAREVIPAVTLWRKMLSMLFETGHPWITFKDSCNLRSPQQHVGVVHSSNLCTEITLNTSADEIAVCNLGSINLVRHLKGQTLDTEKLQATIKTAMRMLDNVIDLNYYAVDKAKHSNMRHRPVGLGLMGFQDALHALAIPYSTEEAVAFADHVMEHISYSAIAASVDLAQERGSYPTYQGSLWSQGILPIDSLALLQANRGEYWDSDVQQTLDWASLRERVRTLGMRNSNVMAIAPTATISNICGVSQSIEPTYRNLYVKSNLSGEFTVVNQYLVADLKRRGLWDEVMVNDLKYYDGVLQKIDRIPEDLKNLYRTAFEIAPRWLVEAASRRQKWIDQAQSLNLYMGQASGKKLDVLYRMAWIKGLKTTYYLRSLGATDAEKSTITDTKLNAVPGDLATPKLCSIDDPDCEACQ